MTESKALEFRLIQSEKLAMTGQMSAEIGYKLRNYLTVLIEHIDLLGINSSIRDDEKATRSVGGIGEQLERIEQFSLGLMELGQLKLKKEPTDLNVLTEHLVAFIQGQRRFRQMEFKLYLDVCLPMLEAFPGQIQQILLNLFANAADAMGLGTVAAKTFVDDEGQVVVSVANTGPGVPEEIVARIFETGLRRRKRATGLACPSVAGS